MTDDLTNDFNEAAGPRRKASDTAKPTQPEAKQADERALTIASADKIKQLEGLLSAPKPTLTPKGVSTNPPDPAKDKAIAAEIERMKKRLAARSQELKTSFRQAR